MRGRPPAAAHDLDAGRIHGAEIGRGGDADFLGAGGFGDAARGAAGGGDGEDTMDPQLAAALEASYAAQTGAGQQANEDDLIQQAIAMSQREEEARQRQQLREQQENELQE